MHHHRSIILGFAALAISLGTRGVASASASQGFPRIQGRSLPKTVTHLMPRLDIKLPPEVLPHVNLRPAPAITANPTWAGYLDTAASGQKIKYVNSYFNVPSVNCAKSPIGTAGQSDASQWVG